MRGYEVVEAADDHAGLKVALGRGRVDAVVLALSNGARKAWQRIRAARPGLPVHFAGAHPGIEASAALRVPGRRLH